MKLRRDAIARHYAAEIDAMYEARPVPAPRPTPTEPPDWDEQDNVFR
jgi:long-chain acyl-CoA synthetase